jgi:hypothetical protein
MDEPTLATDDVAAHRALLGLGMQPSAENIEVLARQMALHRREAVNFFLQKAAVDLQVRLEERFSELNRPGQDGWPSGYAAAQQEAANWFVGQQGDQHRPPPPTRGKILRSLLRTRKEQNAVVMKRKP